MSLVDSTDLAGTGAGQGAAMVGFIAETGAMPRTALQKLRETVSPEDFGAVGDGIADDSVALQAAIDAAGTRTLSMFGTYLVSSELYLRNSLIMRGASSEAAIVSTDPTLSILVGNAVTNVRIASLRLKYSSAGSTAYTACVKLNQAVDCLVEDCAMEGLPWSGVWLVASQACEARNCRFSDSLCLTPNTSAVAITDGSTDCRVIACRDTSGCHVSFFVQDQTSPPSRPVYRTRIEGCFSRYARAYGAAIYLGSTAAVNTYNEIVDCNIADVVGDIAGSEGQYNRGSPIYVVGYASGGAKVFGNMVANGCQQTDVRENAPAGISISNMPAGCDPAIVQGNTVTDMHQGDGISVTTCPAGCVIGPNSVRMPEVNDGSGPGGETLRGAALRIENSSNVSVAGGRYSNSGGGQAVLVLATSGDQENISLAGLQAASAASAVVQATAVDHSLRKIAISGVVARTMSDNNAFQFQRIDGLTLSGSIGEAGGAVALNCSNTSTARISGNRFSSIGSYGVAFGGTCTNSRYDVSNTHSGLITNGSTGFRVEFEVTSIPIAGDFRLGDRAVNVSGTLPPSGWINTVAGSPGTFTVE